MDPSHIDDDMLFELFIALPHDSFANPKDSLQSQELTKTCREAPSEEPLPLLDVANLDGESGYLGSVQFNPTSSIETNDLPSVGQKQQNFGSLMSMDNLPAFSQLTVPQMTERNHFSDFNPNPEFGGLGNDTNPSLQDSMTQLWQSSTADLAPYRPASLNINYLPANSQVKYTSGRLQGASNPCASISNTFGNVFITSGLNCRNSLSASISTISTIPNRHALPYRQRKMHLKPIVPIQPRPSLPTLPANQGSLALSTSPSVIGTYTTIIKPAVVLPEKRQAKRKPGSATVLDFGPQPKKKQNSRKTIPFCNTFALPTNPTKDSVPRKNMRPCLRCKDYKKACTGGYPCEGCQPHIRRTLAQRSGQTLKWTLCIESDIWDLNCFMHNMRWMFTELSCEGLDEPLLRKRLRFQLPRSLPFFKTCPYSIREIRAGEDLHVIQGLGQYIVGHLPVVHRLWGEGQEPTILTQLVPKPSHSGSPWTHPKAPSEICAPELDGTGLVWVAICLHSKALFQYLGCSPGAFWYPVLCLNQFFISVLDMSLSGYRHARTLEERMRYYILAVVNLRSFTTLANRDFGNIHQAFEETGQNRPWGPSMNDHILDFCQYYLDKIKKDFVRTLSDTAVEKVLSSVADLELASEEIAQMDLTQWIHRRSELETPRASLGFCSNEKDDNEGKEQKKHEHQDAMMRSTEKMTFFEEKLILLEETVDWFLSNCLRVNPRTTIDQLRLEMRVVKR